MLAQLKKCFTFVLVNHNQKLFIMKTAITPESIEFTRINNDVNGNPRYVCHFLAFITDADRAEADKNTADIFGITTLYNIALRKAHKLGGRKYHTKSYGGGIVFQSYNIADLQKRIVESLESELQPA